MCDSRHPETLAACRLDGPHPDHLTGYGKTSLTWPNPTFTPMVSRIPQNKLVELAQRVREANADTLS